MLDSTRKSVCFRLILIFTAVLLLSTTFHLRADSSNQPTVSLALPDGSAADLEFSCQPALGACSTPASSDNQSSWQCSDYSLQTEVSQVQGGYSVAFQLTRAGGASFDLYAYSATVSVPYSPGDAVWSYNLLPTDGIMETDLGNPVSYTTASNLGIPFVILVDNSGISQLAMGLMSQDHLVTMQGNLSGNAAEYALSITQLDTSNTNQAEDAFFISRTQDTWFNQAKAYTSAVDARRGYVPLDIPPVALNPTYDSWYWTADNINQSLVWELAQLSHSLGFKSYLFDSGWDTHAGEYAEGLDGTTGDYSPPVESFPDFPGLLSDIRGQLGMQVMLWMQQYALGRQSVYYPQMAGAMSYVPDPTGGPAPVETLALCPRVLETGQHMTDLFGRIMDAYQPDGLWFDWQEYIPAMCVAPHHHDYDSLGKGYNSTQQLILNTVMQRNPNIFMEMRWPFANLNNKPYVQLWQPVDSPQDYEAMRLRAMTMRPFSSGVLMGTDEMYWDPTLSDIDMARFISTVVFTGVPYFGPNLIAAPPYQNTILKAWLDFYEAHKTELIEGQFEPYGDLNHPDQIIEGSSETFIYYGNGYNTVNLSKPNDHIYVVNASQSQNVDLKLIGLKPGTYTAAVSDLILSNVRTSEFSTVNGQAHLTIDLPVGCLLSLGRRDVRVGRRSF